MTVGKSETSNRVWEVLIKLSIPLVLAIGAMVIAHEVRLSVVESNRFTNKDAASMEERIMTRLPPAWLRDDLSEIKSLLKDTQIDLHNIQTRLSVLESK